VKGEGKLKFLGEKTSECVGRGEDFQKVLLAKNSPLPLRVHSCRTEAGKKKELSRFGQKKQKKTKTLKRGGGGGGGGGGGKTIFFPAEVAQTREICKNVSGWSGSSGKAAAYGAVGKGISFLEQRSGQKEQGKKRFVLKMWTLEGLARKTDLLTACIPSERTFLGDTAMLPRQGGGCHKWGDSSIIGTKNEDCQKNARRGRSTQWAPDRLRKGVRGGRRGCSEPNRRRPPKTRLA